MALTGLSKMLQSNDCNVVMCRDLNCKFCSTLSNTDTPAMNGEAYIVYTCESTKCKLCREDTDVLLDLFCPFNTVEEITEMRRKLNNITEAPWCLCNDDFSVAELQDNASDSRTTEGKTTTENPNFEPNITPSRESSQMLRDVLQSTPGQLTDKQGTSFEIIQNLQAVDERLLTDLERELQMDQLEDLPELMDVGICDFISR